MNSEGVNNERVDSKRLRSKSILKEIASKKTIVLVPGKTPTKIKAQKSIPRKMILKSKSPLGKQEPDKRNILSKFTTKESSAYFGQTNNTTRRIQPNDSFNLLKTKYQHRSQLAPRLQTSIGDGRGKKSVSRFPHNFVKKNLQAITAKPQTNRNVGSSPMHSADKMNNSNNKNGCMNEVIGKSVLVNFRKPSVMQTLPTRNECSKNTVQNQTNKDSFNSINKSIGKSTIHIQTSCLIETFAKSCQTLRQSQIDIINIKQIVQSLLDKINKNVLGYEFTYVIFQTAAETLNLKYLRINQTKKSSMSIARIVKLIQNLDDISMFDDNILHQYETKELIEVLNWLLNDIRFEINGTTDPMKIYKLMDEIDAGRKKEISPQAFFEIKYSLQTHHFNQWSSLKNQTSGVIQCYMFISPTKVYKYLRHGFSKHSHKQYLTFENHIPLLEEETENFLMWDLRGTYEEDHELIMVGVVHMINDGQYFEQTNFQDQIMYRVTNPESLIIKYVLLYSRSHYQTYMRNNPPMIKQNSFLNLNINVNMMLWVILGLMIGLSFLFIIGFVSSSTDEHKEIKQKGELWPELGVLNFLLKQI